MRCNLVGGPSNGTALNLHVHNLPSYVDIPVKMEPMTRAMSAEDAALPAKMEIYPVHRYNLRYTLDNTPFYLYEG